MILNAYSETCSALSSNGPESVKVPSALFYGFAITTIITQSPMAGFVVGIMSANAAVISVFVEKILDKIDPTGNHAFPAKVSVNVVTALCTSYLVPDDLFDLSRKGNALALFVLFQMYPT